MARHDEVGRCRELTGYLRRVVREDDPAPADLELARGRPAEGTRLAREARGRAERRFSADARVAGTIRVYEGLL